MQVIQINHDQVTKAHHEIVQVWKEANTMLIWPQNAIAYQARNICYVTAQLSFDKIIWQLNQVMLNRVQNSGREVSSKRISQIADFLMIIN